MTQPQGPVDAGRPLPGSPPSQTPQSQTPPSQAPPSQGAPSQAAQPASAANLDPAAVVRSKPYLSALVLAAILGIPISAIAYGFLALVSKIQTYVFDDLPKMVLDGPVPAWWPIPWVALSGLLTALTISYLPGNAGHSPAFGFKTGGGPPSGPELISRLPGRAHHPQPGRRPRSGGAVDRDRRRTRSPRGATGEEGCAADGGHHHGLGGQLRRHQHLARVAAAGCLPDHGGGRNRRGDIDSRRRAWPAGLRDRRADLPGPGFLDRLRQLLAGTDHGATSGRPHPRHDGLCAADGRGRRRLGLDHPVDRTVPATAGARQPGAGHHSARPADRAAGNALPTGQRQQFHPGAVLRPGCAARTGGRCGGILGGRADPAGRL